MKNRCIAFAVLLFLNCSFSNCFLLMKNDSQETNIETNQNDVTNDYGNYIRVGPWIYFSHPNDERRLYRMQFDGSSIEKIGLTADIDKLGWLSSDSAYLYGASFGELYKISLINPCEVHILKDSGVYSPILQNNNIYYLDFLKGFKLFKIKKDASNLELIIDDLVASPIVHKLRIYYRNEKDNHSLYRIEFDGSNKTKLNNVRTWCPVFFNNEVYFMNNSDSGKLYQMNLEKLTMEKLSEERFVCPVFISNGWLYLIQRDIGANKLIKLKIDPKDTKSFDLVFDPNPEYIENIYLREPYLIIETSEFLTNPSNDVVSNVPMSVYKISLDGSIIEKMIP